MARVAASIEVPGTVYEAERVWYDTARWPGWVDQLERVLEVQGDWPRPGSRVVWESGPAGRGKVAERVLEYEPRSGLVTEVEDDSICARQSVTFTPAEDGVHVRLSLDYRLRRRSPLSAVIDVLFVRRLMGASLARTLTQFRASLQVPSRRAFE